MSCFFAGKHLAIGYQRLKNRQRGEFPVKLFSMPGLPVVAAEAVAGEQYPTIIIYHQAVGCRACAAFALQERKDHGDRITAALWPALSE